MEGNDKKTWITLGVVGIGALVAAFLFARSSSTSYGVDAGSASVANTIAVANENAQTVNANQALSFATLATNTAVNANNNQTAIALSHDNNATQVQLAKLASDATQQSAATTTAAQITALVQQDQTQVTLAEIAAGLNPNNAPTVKG